jgi:sugar phosphate isomerase/epimerase
MNTKRTVLLSVLADDLDWVTPLVETLNIGVEIKDFALPSDETSMRERAFELWHMWRSAATAKVPVVVHAPYLDLVPGSPDPEVSALARKQHELALTLAQSLGAQAMVFHSGFNPLIRGPDYLPHWVSSTAAYFEQFLDEFPDITFLVENMWENSPDSLCKLIDLVNHPRFRVCCDVGHIMVYSQQPPEIWLRHLGLRLGHVHVSDNQGQWDQELALGKGTCSWDRIFTTLDMMGYFGMLTLEMHGEENIRDSLEFLRTRDLL